MQNARARRCHRTHLLPELAVLLHIVREEGLDLQQAVAALLHLHHDGGEGVVGAQDVAVLGLAARVRTAGQLLQTARQEIKLKNSS